ncbi:helix-turn-helix transcriptional regulator [Clostridium sp. JN-1]|uniref:helix-turn-helix transcriptional regulator n=1 Tax=Clostridium sp. JN-1 TaxID=2483110 RepID=UPI0016801036|nr:helix-turn-helix transcriptional regulator [Clostridium sp. JN-1]
MLVNYKLKSLRVKNSVTQKELASLLHMSVSAYSRKEIGSRSFTISEAGKLAVFFNTTIEDIFLR